MSDSNRYKTGAKQVQGVPMEDDPTRKDEVAGIAGCATSSTNPETLIEKLAEWECDRRTRQIKANGGASSWFRDCMPETQDSFRTWAKQVLEIVGSASPPKDLPREISDKTDAELVTIMLKGARLSDDKTSNRRNMHGALRALRPYLKHEAQPASDHIRDATKMVDLDTTTKRESSKEHAALRLIYLTDWGWAGAGKNDRLLGQHGKLAASALDLPHTIHDGWPTGEERAEIRRCKTVIEDGASK